MKKLLCRISTFVPLAAVGYLLLICLMGDLGWVRTGITTMGEAGHLNSRVKDIRHYHDVDILFLGSSHCYRTFDTRTFNEAGYTCFNLGSSNQTPMQTYVLLQQYLDSLNPRQVIFEVHPDIMRNDGVESAVNVLCNVPLTGEAVKMALRTHNMKALNTLIYATYSQKIRHRLDTFAEDTLIGHYRYIPGGFCEVDTCEFEIKQYPKKELTINSQQLMALKKCLAMMDERHIPYLLVETQDAQQLRTTYTNHEWFEQQMAALGPYHYAVLPMVDTVHFFNSDHLGKPGREMYNAYLIEYLITNDIITPRL